MVNMIFGRQRALRRIASVFLGASALAGCGMFGSDQPSGPPPATCPTSTVLKPLSQTAVFAPGAARQPTGVAFYGILPDITVKCEGSGAALRASIDVIVIGERGPAAGNANAVDLQYFVAVTGPNQAVLSKQSFPVHVDIAANARRAGVTDHIEQAIPMTASLADTNIIVGFQQSPDVVDFYRHFRGR